MQRVADAILEKTGNCGGGPSPPPEDGGEKFQARSRQLYIVKQFVNCHTPTLAPGDMPSIRYPLSAFIVAVAVLIQISLIFRASLVLPPDQYDLTQACVTSTKGGKMSGDYKVLCTVGYPCPTYRDCEVGRSGVCSISDPCTPCSDFPGYPDPGCTLCAESPTYGDCGFVEGYGCVI